MRERLKRIFILFMAAAVLLGAAPSTAFTALADEKETENEDLEIPKVFHKDDDNEVVRIVIGKTPSITIGKSSTISIAVKNTTDTDWLESEIWIAPEADYQGYYDEIEDEDGEIIKTMNATYPFEITDSLNKHYKIGHINAGQCKKEPEGRLLSCKAVYFQAFQRRGRYVGRVPEDRHGMGRDKGGVFHL